YGDCRLRSLRLSFVPSSADLVHNLSCQPFRPHLESHFELPRPFDSSKSSPAGAELTLAQGVSPGLKWAKLTSPFKDGTVFTNPRWVTLQFFSPHTPKVKQQLQDNQPVNACAKVVHHDSGAFRQP